jgi:hypothetical protein
MEVIKISLVNYNTQISLKNGMSVRIKDLFDWENITLDVYFKLCSLCEEKIENKKTI